MIILLPCLIIAFTVHEFFHAYASYKLGDNGVIHDKRLNLNPINHIDPLGFIMLLVVGFGWAKPVVVNPNVYRNPVKGMALVALAGPLSNIALALIGIILHIIFRWQSVSLVFFYFWMVNIVLCLFNLIPIPPLDGSKIIGYFMKWDTYQEFLKYQWMGIFLLVFMIYMDIFSLIINPVVNAIFGFIYRL